ncbi:hypothetical protein C0Q70_13583 [Pomacea canaliculata]|uniref:Uncharacterized protein n=1 Tax=Pomacea canaliculata TaxID=400727 RepID=A0A2T7NXM3_POMCA|nr:hypothetical protein C0Q70_13583 [Pomacea canaliculata]
MVCNTHGQLLERARTGWTMAMVIITSETIRYGLQCEREASARRESAAAPRYKNDEQQQRRRCRASLRWTLNKMDEDPTGVRQFKASSTDRSTKPRRVRLDERKARFCTSG